MLARSETEYTRKAHGAILAEFGPVLYLSLIMLAVSGFIFVRLALGLSIAYFIGLEAVGKAAVATDYKSALQSARNCSHSMLYSALGVLGGLQPALGMEGDDGIQMDLLLTDGETLLPECVKLDGDVPPPLDRSTRAEYRVNANFVLAPLLMSSRLPFVSNIPGLGKALPVAFVCTRLAEHAP
jgi:hypothetical protein